MNSLSSRILLGACLLIALVALVFAATHRGSAALGAAALVVAVLTIVVLAGSLVRLIAEPMTALALAARRYSAGDLSVRVPESGIKDLKRLAASLNQMAATTEVARDKVRDQASSLEASKQEAERAGAAKSEFLSRMSHELRTPLNAILGFAQLLELEDLDAQQRDNVAHIVSGGRHLLDLINEVLEISRLEIGTASPSIEPVHVESVVQGAAELVMPLAARRKISLEVRLGPDADSWVSADQQRLKQILLNLLANAVKYNREEGSVTVSLKRADSRLRIQVTDTGQGIAQDQLPRLFTPFERLGAESTGVEGTGLGLVLALRLAEAMDGTMGVESQPWIGSTFHVELPLTAAPPDAVIPANVARRPSDLSLPALSGELTVLYIEDDVANVQLMTKLFADEPRAELMTTLHGRLGLELARLHQPDLVLLDLHLPDISGDEVLKRLRDDDLTRAIPVIIVSADATEDQKSRLKLMGAKRYLTKPLELDAVLGAVREVLELDQAVEAV